MAEWKAFYQLEPVGEERDDWRIAAFMALTRNLAIDPKKDNPLPPEDFLLKFEFEEEKSREDLLSKVKMLQQIFGGNILRNQ